MTLAVLATLALLADDHATALRLSAEDARRTREAWERRPRFPCGARPQLDP
jgi:hypothetical protein